MHHSTLWKGIKTGILLCLTIALFFTACSSKNSEQNRKTAMGRYVEEALPLPEELATLLYLGLDSQDQFLLLGTGSNGEYIVRTSKDGGETWHPDHPSWLNELEQFPEINSIALDSEDRVWLTYETEEEEVSESGTEPVFPLVLLDGQTTSVQEIRLLDRNGNNAQNFLLGEDKIAADFGKGLSLFDVTTEEEILTVGQENYLQQGDYFLTEDELAFSDGESMRIYDATDGKQLTEIAFQKTIEPHQDTDFFDMNSNRTVIAPTPEEGVYSYCNSSGIYRMTGDGLIHERILAGDLSSLAMPTYSIKNMFVTEDAYFVYVTDKESMPWNLVGPTLLRYRYDSDMATVPSTELKICSLYDSPTVRQAAGIFQRENPDVRVYFEVILTEEGGMQKQDALRLLSTELIAGKGPDLLVLDGLPVESYVEKGALLDLSTMISASHTEDLLSNILDCYKIDNKRYAIPTRFSIPAVLTDGETLDRIKTLGDLANYVTALESPQLGTPPEELFDLLYPLFCGQWFSEDGKLNEIAVSEGLSDLKRIMDLYDGIPTDLIWNTRSDFRVWSIGWIDGWTPFSLGNLTAIDQLSGPYTVLQEREGIFKPYPSAEEAAIYPRAIMGINAAGEKQDLAVQFLACMLSCSVQSQVLGDGMPVSKSAIAANRKNPYTGEFQRFGVSFYDGFQEGLEKSLTMPMYWPDSAWFENFFQDLERIEARTNVNDTLKGIVAEEAELYFKGEKSLSETVTYLKKKVDLYQSE